MKRILGIGNALVDVMTLIDNDLILGRFSLPKGSMQLVDSQKSDLIKRGTSNFRKSLASGGSAANTIHGLAMLKAETGFIGSIGKDETGDFFERDMKTAGVNTLLMRRNTATGTAVALISPDSERTFATHLGAAVELGADDLDPEDFKSFNILYLEGYLINKPGLIRKACSIATDNNMKIALDLASFNVVETYPDLFKEIICRYVNIVFANEEEARVFTGKVPEKAMSILSEMCDIAIIKTGSRGSMVSNGNKVIEINAIPVKGIDTTGAGDLYASGFLYGFSNNLDIEKCGRIGSLLAGSVIETIGARIPDERWDEIKDKIDDIINT